MKYQKQKSLSSWDDGDSFLEDLRASEPAACHCFLQEYRPKIFSFVFSILMNNEDAEDVTQETLIKALDNVSRFKGDSSLTTWVLRIARNAAIDLKRKGVRGELLLRSYSQSQYFEEVNARDIPDKAYQMKESLDVVANVINELSVEHREVLILREVDGLSYDEIAEVIDISRGTVMSRLFYARKKLQEALVARSELEQTIAEDLVIKNKVNRQARLKIVG